MRVVPLKPEHLECLELQEAQKNFNQLILDPDHYVEMVTENGHAYAVIDDEKTYCVAGLIELWPERQLLWSLMSKDAGPHLFFITRAAKNLLTLFGSKRVEATIDVNFKEGHRFIKLLGFQMEAELMRAYEPDGTDCSLYARIT